MSSMVRRIQRMQPHKIFNSRGVKMTVPGRTTKSNVGSKLGATNERAPKPNSRRARGSRRGTNKRPPAKLHKGVIDLG